MGRLRSDLSYAIIAFILCFFFPSALGTCAYPSDLVGTWYTSHETTPELTWTNETVSSFDYAGTVTLTGVIYSCFLQDGDYYISRSTTTKNIVGTIYYAYTCWTFTKISSNKYLYNIKTNPYGQLGQARAKLLETTVSVTSYTDVCDDTTRVDGEYSILLKNGTASSEKIACPDPLLATGTYTISDGSRTFCDGTSWLDGCTTTGVLSANYSVCSTEIFYSAAGEVYCLYSESVSASDTSTYYVTLWNTDASPDGTSNFYYTCMVVSSVSGTVYMTQYPMECLNDTNMNSTYISTSPGLSIELTTNTTCVATSSDDNTLIIGVVVGVVLFVALAVLIAVLIFIFVCKKKTSTSARSKVVPDTLPNTAMSQSDRAKRAMFTPAPRSAGPGGRHYDYYDSGQNFGSEISMRPTVSQLANYRTPTPFISDSKVDVEFGATRESTAVSEAATPIRSFNQDEEGEAMIDQKLDSGPSTDATVAGPGTRTTGGAHSIATAGNTTTTTATTTNASIADTPKEISSKATAGDSASDASSVSAWMPSMEDPRPAVTPVQAVSISSIAGTVVKTPTGDAATTSTSPNNVGGAMRAILPGESEEASLVAPVAAAVVKSGSEGHGPTHKEDKPTPSGHVENTKSPPKPSPGPVSGHVENTKSPPEPSPGPGGDQLDHGPRANGHLPTDLDSQPKALSPGFLEPETMMPPSRPPSPTWVGKKKSSNPKRSTSKKKRFQTPTKPPSPDWSLSDERHKPQSSPTRAQSSPVVKERVALKKKKKVLSKKAKKKATAFFLPESHSVVASQDMDLDSILDFDAKRLGEPDGAESGVHMDMEGSLPVFSESGDLTPEPTRVTPHGQIHPRRPKPTPRDMPL